MLTKILAAGVLGFIFVIAVAAITCVQDDGKYFWLHAFCIVIILTIGLVMYVIGYYVIPWCFEVLFG